MYLFIDTADLQNLTVALIEKGQILIQKTISAKYQQVEKLLPTIDQILKKTKISIKKIQGIVVVSGPGPFTAIRIGIATANALAFSLNVPVISFLKDDFNSLEDLAKKLIETKLAKNISQLAVPTYGKEPNIQQ